jgi:hypothetical protein
MQVNDSFQPFLSADVQTGSIVQHQSDFTETQSTEAPPNKAIASDVAWLLLPIWFLIIVIIFTFAVSELAKAAREGVAHLRYAQRTPCKQCRFFSGNFYLKCAVHPSTVLTEKAVNCPDYCPMSKETLADGGQFGSNLKRR